MKYETPILDVTEFEVEDIILTSDDVFDDFYDD